MIPTRSESASAQSDVTKLTVAALIVPAGPPWGWRRRAPQYTLFDRLRILHIASWVILGWQPGECGFTRPGKASPPGARPHGGFSTWRTHSERQSFALRNSIARRRWLNAA